MVRTVTRGTFLPPFDCGVTLRLQSLLRAASLVVMPSQASDTGTMSVDVLRRARMSPLAMGLLHLSSGLVLVLPLRKHLGSGDRLASAEGAAPSLMLILPYHRIDRRVNS
jgi:hypothetical protein